MEPFIIGDEARDLKTFLEKWTLVNQPTLKGAQVCTDIGFCQDFAETVNLGIQTLLSALEKVQNLDAHKQAAIWGKVCKSFTNYLFQDSSGNLLSGERAQRIASYLSVDLMARGLHDFDRKTFWRNRTRRRDLGYVFSANSPTPLGLSMIGFQLELEFPLPSQP